jgi:hypothetical protein
MQASSLRSTAVSGEFETLLANFDVSFTPSGR